MRKRWLIALAVPVLIGLYNVDAFIGYQKFASLCDKEGGSKFQARVDKSVGWEAISEDASTYQIPLKFGHALFVKFRGKNGQLMEALAKASTEVQAKGYDVVPADATNIPRYRLTIKQGLLPDDSRMSKTRFEVSDLRLATLVASHTSFSYAWADPDRVVLGAPTSSTCHSGVETDAFFETIHTSAR